MKIEKGWFRQHWNYAAACFVVLIYTVAWLPEKMVQQVYHGDRQKSIASANNYAKLVDDNRKTIIQAIGGLLLFGTFYIGLRQLEITRETQITDRFTKAVGYLGVIDSQGNKQLETRLGGIYALERIAHDSAYDHWPIMEIFTAYVRANAPWRSETAESAADVIPLPDQDIQAIMRAIGRRRHEQDRGSLDLSNVNLRHIDLSGTQLEGANLFRAHLEKAYLFEANLRNTGLSGAHLERADLYAAHLEQADLSNAHLEGASLMEAHLEGSSLLQAHLEGAYLNGACLHGANLLAAHLERSILRDAHFGDAILQAVHLDNADLRGADLSQAQSLHQDQLKATLGDHTTKLPPSLTFPRHWSKAQRERPS